MIFLLLLVIATITGAFTEPSNGTFQIITRSEANVNLNLRVGVSSGAVILDSHSSASASATSRVTEGGKFELAPNVYAGVDSEGYLIQVSSNDAATGFAIRSGKLTYRDAGNFYAVPYGGSQYRICIHETVSTSIRITVSAYVPGESSVVSKYPTNTQGPVTVTTYLRPSTASTASKETTPASGSTVTVTVIETPVEESPTSTSFGGTVTVTYTESPVSTPSATISGGVTVTVTASIPGGIPPYRNSTAFIPRGIKTILQ